MEPIWLAFICGIAVGWAVVPFILSAIDHAMIKKRERDWKRRVSEQRFE